MVRTDISKGSVEMKIDKIGQFFGWLVVIMLCILFISLLAFGIVSIWEAIF